MSKQYHHLYINSTYLNQCLQIRIRIIKLFTVKIHLLSESIFPVLIFINW